jgi:hypothetical protein
LDNIINSQRPNHDKSGLGYNQTERVSSSKTTDQETHLRSYAETVRGDKNFYKEDHRDTPPPREEEGFKRVTPFRIYSTPRYQTIFFGLCYACNNFGHKVVNCRANSKKQKQL